MIEEKFNKSYYDGIWGTIHRHDYCETRANEIIQKYGKCRILDIGTGCGELVRVLREKGCEAWGLEISEFALKNKCSDFVLQGDVRNIPFKDDFFDVIHSNGLWCYIPEEDIFKAVKEIYRVGKFQFHNIDTTDGQMDENIKAITFKSQNWWNEKLKIPKILIACPVHECKEYAMQRWIDNVKNFTFQNFDIFLVDNSPNENFYNRWKDKINIIHLKETENEKDMCRRIAISMEVIRQKFINGNYYRWLNLEIDVLPQNSNLIEIMLKYGQDTDWIAHTYPHRGSESEAPVQAGVGCGMFSRRIMEYFNFNETGFDKCPDGWLWDKVRPLDKFTTIEMWSHSKMKHIEI